MNKENTIFSLEIINEESKTLTVHFFDGDTRILVFSVPGYEKRTKSFDSGFPLQNHLRITVDGSAQIKVNSEPFEYEKVADSQTKIVMKDQTKEQNKNELEKLAMNIVYQIGDELGASVEKRQASNDRCIDFVWGILKEQAAKSFSEGRAAGIVEFSDKLRSYFQITGEWSDNEAILTGEKIDDIVLALNKQTP